jgi:hypothetical protein
MGARGRKCPVCSIPALCAQVDALLSAGESYPAIASAIGTLNKHAIARHRRHAFPDVVTAVPSGDPLAASDARLAVLAERCEAQWLASVAGGDGKAALDALKTAVRLELENRSRIQEKQEQTAEAAKVDDKNTPQAIDEMLRLYREKQDARMQRESELREKGYISCPLCGSDKNLIHPSGIAVLWKPVKQIYDNYCDEKEAEATKRKEQENADTITI